LVGTPSRNGDENGEVGTGIVERNDRKTDQPEDIASLAFSFAPITELELDITAFDLDKTIPPLTLVKHEPAPRTEDDNSDRTYSGH
jgi:hypothetical protein